MSAEVKVHLNLPDLAGVLFESELEVLEDLGDESVSLAGQQWTGWKYGPNYPEEQKSTSNGAWAWQMMSPTEAGGQYRRGVEITNDAQIKPRTGTKKNGEPYSQNQVGKYYADYVHRSGSTELEVDVVIERIRDELIPDALVSLTNAILSNAGRDRVIIDLEPNRVSDIDVFDL